MQREEQRGRTLSFGEHIEMAIIETTSDAQKDLTLHSIKGEATRDELIRIIENYQSEKPLRYVIWDFSEADVSNLSDEDLRSILAVGKKLAEYRKGGKTALVVPHDLSFGLGRMYESLTDFESFWVGNRAFRSMEEAEEWLGIAR